MSLCITGQVDMPGFRNGDLSVARFNDIQGIVVLPKSDILGDSSFLVSEQNHVRLVNMRDQTVCTFCSTNLQSPKGMAIFRNSVLVCDSRQHRIKMITLDGRRVSNFAGNGIKGCSTGRVTDVSFDSPTGICVVGEDVFVTDSGNHRVVRITNGFATVVAGIGKVPGFADGPVQKSLTNFPTDIFAHDGKIYFNDTGNSKIRCIHSGFASVSTMVEANEPVFGCAINSLGELIVGSEFTAYKFNKNTRETSTVLGDSVEQIKCIICASKNFYILGCVNTILRVEDSEVSILESSQNISMMDLKQMVKSNKQNQSHISQLEESWQENSYSKPSYFDLIYCYEQDLLEIFHYYCSNGSYNFNDISEMSKNQFVKLAKDCMILDNQLTSNLIFIIYEEATKQSPTFKMGFDEFLHGLALLAAKKFGSPQVSTIIDLSNQDEEFKTMFRKLLFDYIIPNSGRRTSDPSPVELSEPSVAKLWSQHQENLHKIFIYYSQKKRPQRDNIQWVKYSKGLGTMNMEEFFVFCSDFEIFPQFFSKVQLSKFFTSSSRLTIDQSSQINVAKEGTVLNFVEFLDCLGRLALSRFGEHPLSSVYKTTKQRIEGLLEHMLLSQGSKHFACQNGGRLFSGVESPLRKKITQSVKHATIGRKLQRAKLLYSDYSVAKKKMNTSQNEISELRMSEEQEHQDCRCSVKDVVLYLALDGTDEQSWKYIAAGNLTLTNKLLLAMQDGEGAVVFSKHMSSTTVPVVEEKDLFHIFRESVLFDNDNIYALQFPSVSSSQLFEREYEMIENSNNDHSSFRMTTPSTPTSNIDNSFATPKKQESTPKVSKVSFDSPSKRSSSKTELDYSSIQNTSPIAMKSPSTPQVQHTRVSQSSQAKDFFEQPSSLEKRNDEITSFKNTVKQFEHLVVKMMAHHLDTVLETNITKENLGISLLERVKWATALMMSGNAQPFLSDCKPVTQLEVIETKKEALKPLLLLDPFLCSSIESLNSYYDILTKQLPTGYQYYECYVRDGLGVSMFNFKQRWFCVAEGETYRLEIFTFNNPFDGVYLNGEEVVPLSITESWIIIPISIPQTERDHDLDPEMKEFKAHRDLSFTVELFDKHTSSAFVTLNVEFAVFPNTKALNHSYGTLKEKISEEFRLLPSCFQSLALFSSREAKCFSSS